MVGVVERWRGGPWNREKNWEIAQTFHQYNQVRHFFYFFFHVFFILVIEYLVEVCLIVIVLFHAYTYILPEEDTGLKQLSSISVTEWVQRLKTNNLFYGALQSGAYFWGGPPPAPPHKHN